MPNKIIAVVGATGAQGGGIAEGDPRRQEEPTIRSEPHEGCQFGTKAKELAASGAEVVAADRMTRRASNGRSRAPMGHLRDVFLGPLLAGEGNSAGGHHGAGAAKTAGLQHVIWSTLEDTRKWVPLERRPDADADGQVQGAALRRQGRGGPDLHGAGVPTTFLLTSFYWDNLIHFGMGPRTRARRQTRLHLPMGDKKLPGIAAEDIGKCAYGIFKRGREFIGRPWASRASTSPARRWRGGLTQALGKEVALQRRAARSLSRSSVSPAPTIWATCSSSSATLKSIIAAHGALRRRALSIRNCRASRLGSRATRIGLRSPLRPGRRQRVHVFLGKTDGRAVVIAASRPFFKRRIVFHENSRKTAERSHNSLPPWLQRFTSAGSFPGA